MRPVAPWELVVPLVLAAGLGFALGLDARVALLVCAAVAVGALLLVWLELAVLLVVVSAVLGDYLRLVDPRLTEALGLLLVGSWAVRRGWRRREGRPRSPVLLAAAGFLAVLAAAFVLHPHAAAGWAAVHGYVVHLVVLVVLVDAMRSGLAPTRVAAAYVAACSIAAGLGVGGFVLGLDDRVGGAVGDPNDLAFLLLAALPLGLALRARATRPWLYDMGCLLLVVGLVGTLSRGAVLGLATAAAFAVLTRVVSRRDVLVRGVVVVTLVALTAGLLAGSVSSSLDQKSAVDPQNVAERFELWQAASAMTLADPVLGQGPGAFSLYQQDYRRVSSELPYQLDTAHSTYLEVSAELGVLGLLAWLGMLGTAGGVAWARWRRDRPPLAAGVATGLVAAMVAAVFATEQYLLPLWLLMALAAALGVPETSVAPAGPFPDSRSALPRRLHHVRGTTRS